MIEGAAVYCCDWRDLLPVVDAAGGADTLIVDTPYSERVHAGHDGQVAHLVAAGVTDMRRELQYPAWTAADVAAFVAAWSPRVGGWFASITDHELAVEWAAALDAAGRYVFAPLPFVAPGSRVRLAGDGPSNWTTWIVVARPRNKEFATWGTLPGAYVLPPGQGGAMPVVGGKPLWLLEQLVRDYSRPGDLIVDPCCGAGTLAAAALRLGRHAIVGDLDPAHAELAARWIRDPGPRCPTASEARQVQLFGGGAR